MVKDYAMCLISVFSAIFVFENILEYYFVQFKNDLLLYHSILEDTML